jgi:hypothetical protein
MIEEQEAKRAGTTAALNALDKAIAEEGAFDSLLNPILDPANTHASAIAEGGKLLAHLDEQFRNDQEIARIDAEQDELAYRKTADKKTKTKNTKSQ